MYWDLDTRIQGPTTAGRDPSIAQVITGRWLILVTSKGTQADITIFGHYYIFQR